MTIRKATELVKETLSDLDKGRESNFRTTLMDFLQDIEQAERGIKKQELKIAKLQEFIEVKRAQASEFETLWDKGMKDMDVWDYREKCKKPSIDALL